MTVAPAIAAFAAAGNDIDAMEKAIGEASYLDATPGEDRQKLRGSPRLLRCITRVGPSASSGSQWFGPAAGSKHRASAAMRTKVKKLKKEAIAKAEAAAKDAATRGPKERSPHTKEVCCRSCYALRDEVMLGFVSIHQWSPTKTL